jgi:peptide-methionine (S)-S-oxide reductase
MARPFLAAAVAQTALAVLFAASPIRAQEAVVKAPPAATMEPTHAGLETAIFAGGCFWGVEGVFSHVTGVVSATSGYTGGAAATAHYDEVATGETGHAESVKVTFDPRRVNYADLLRIYFSVVADPTLLNRQGPDHGTQYRTALFPLTPAQATVARAYIAQLTNAHVFPRPIATQLERQRGFYPAEAVHQDFMATPTS